MEYEDVFKKKPVKKITGLTMGVILGKKEVKGDVGLEIEVEGKSLPFEDETPRPWVYHVDGSLRGESAEYVLGSPIAFNEVENALKVLWKEFDKKKSTIFESNRTSVHVHLNMQRFHINRLTSFFGLYFAIEDPLTQWCGEHRVGNLFCLRASDATGIISQLRRFIKADGKYEFSEGMHYAGLNASALKKFGSVEIRTMRGVSNPLTILDWVSILERLHSLSADFEDPREICQMFSRYGPQGFFDFVLGDKAKLIRDGINWDNERLGEAMFKGIRLAQDLCYCRNWEDFKAVQLKDDPFNRDLRKVAKKLIDMEASPEATLDPLNQLFTYSEGITLNAGYQAVSPFIHN